MTGENSGTCELTLTDVKVRYDGKGNPQELHVGFAESSGLAFFEYEDGVAQYDGHVHSVDRDKARDAVENLPFVSQVSMEYTGRATDE